MDAYDPVLAVLYVENVKDTLAAAKLGSATAPISNWLANAPSLRLLVERMLGIDCRRELPKFERETLVEWFRECNVPRPTDAEYHAVVYPNLYTNHVRTDRGKAAVRTLEVLGVAVEVPDVAYHSYCQQRTLELEAYTTAILERLDYDVLTSDTECCGLAGSFGYKREYYELSVDVGDRLREPFEAPDTAERTVIASRTSCIEQLDAMLTRQPCHSISLLDPNERD